MKEDTRQAGASYLFIFFEDLINLNIIASNYFSFLQELKIKYGLKKEDVSLSFDDFDSEDRDLLKKFRQDINAYIFRTHSRYPAIREKIRELSVDNKNNDNDSLIHDIYNRLKDRGYLELEEIEQYVSSLEKEFADLALPQLLLEAKDIYHQYLSGEVE